MLKIERKRLEISTLVEYDFSESFNIKFDGKIAYQVLSSKDGYRVFELTEKVNSYYKKQNGELGIEDWAKHYEEENYRFKNVSDKIWCFFIEYFENEYIGKSDFVKNNVPKNIINTPKPN